MLKVGDFSKLAHVTVKTPRHYDELGLLKPVWMKPKIIELPAFTVVGMRYYGRNENQEISGLGDAFNQRVPEIQNIIYKIWAQQPGRQLDGRLDFEYYDEDFKDFAPNFEVLYQRAD